MSEEHRWNPPSKIEELFASTAGNKFASINSPVAGARVEKDLPVGEASVQLYSLGTPNGSLYDTYCIYKNYLQYQARRSAYSSKSWESIMTLTVNLLIKYLTFQFNI